MPKQKKLIEHTIYWKIIVVTVAYCIVMATLKASDNLAHYLRYSLDADGAIVSEPAPRSVNEYRAMNDCILLEDGSQVCGEANIRATAQFEAWKALEAQNKLSTARYDRVRPLLNFNPDSLNPTQSKALHIILSITEQRGWESAHDIAEFINVAWCESKLGLFKENRKNNKPSYSVDRGLWMWNSYHNPHISDDCAYNFACSTNEALTEWNKGNKRKWVCINYID